MILKNKLYTYMNIKKTFIALMICIGLSNCEIKPRETCAEDKPTYLLKDNIGHGASINRISRSIDGIEYHVYYMGNGMEEASVFVVNHTKEKLEVEYLKKQLNK